MSRFLSAPTQTLAPTLAIALFALTGLAAGSPMAAMVDCTDSFWAVTCSADVEAGDIEAGDTDDIVLERIVRIDNDPTCTTIDGGFIVCHT